jgi:Tol biopolymer transport system component
MMGLKLLLVGVFVISILARPAAKRRDRLQRYLGFSWVAVFLVVIFGGPAIKGAHAAVNLAVSEELLVKIPPEVPFDEIEASEDCSRVAFPAPRDDDQCMVVDGVKGTAYYSVGNPFISSTGLVAYLAERDQKTFIVINGKEWGPYDALAEDSPPVFSPDGKRIAFSVRRGEQWLVVTDGASGKGYESILDWKIRFSPDSKHVAYLAMRGPKQIFVVDGVERGEDNQTDQYDAGDIIFSPDGNRVAWPVGARGNQAVVVDGVEGRRYLSVGDITFSDDSRHVAYLAGANTGADVVAHLVIDGREAATSPHIESFALSPDGKRFAYREIRERKNYAVVDGIATECGKISDDPIVFSPDGKQVAFISDKGLMVDGKIQGLGEDPMFSPDGKRLVFVRHRDQKTFVVSDGREGKGYDSILSDNSNYLERAILFSPDSAHIAYLAVSDGKQHVVLDGEEQESFGTVDPASIKFSADGRHLVYVARQNDKFRLIVDGQAGPEYEALYGRVGFYNGKAIRALARRDNELLRVRVTITDAP